MRPARGSIRLKGFQLPLEFPDLDVAQTLEYVRSETPAMSRS